MKHVKVYGTLGPSCGTVLTLQRMFDEGMDGMRLNLSHTTLEQAAPLIEAYHSAANACGVCGELLIDLMGPELRIGVPDQPILLNEGEAVTAASLPFPGEVTDALKTAPDGQELLLDDGKLLLTKLDENRLRVVRGGMLKSRKSIALVGISIDTPALTEQDLINLKLAKSFGVTGVMQPFVRGMDDLKSVHAALNSFGASDLRLLAKIETKEGMQKLLEILPHCDEIVIARGDLGNAMPLWELPAAQKRIETSCLSFGRAFMVVTQMLDSMTHRAVPTRAEVSDIFNAVLDGASSVMLTGETAAGDYPVEAIRYMARTVREAEAFLS